jgi:hypothetical protein
MESDRADIDTPSNPAMSRISGSTCYDTSRFEIFKALLPTGFHRW